MPFKYKVFSIVLLLLLAGCSKEPLPSTPQVLQNPPGSNSTTSTSSQKAGPPRQPVAPPKISLFVSSPQNNTTVTSPNIQVSGKATNSQEVWVNDQQLSPSKDGSFSTSFTLDEGENILLITAGNENGDSEEQELTVTYEVQ